jgi:hypothetical protein
MCAGDFNEILLACEKEGGQPKSQAAMDRFRNALEDCALSDLGFVGDPFTWRINKYQKCDNYIWERLERAVANVELRERFSACRVINGDHRHSDHRPVIIVTDEEVRRRACGPQRFQFEAGWITEEACSSIVENAWKTATEINNSSWLKLYGRWPLIYKTGNQMYLVT